MTITNPWLFAVSRLAGPSPEDTVDHGRPAQEPANLKNNL
jgi:hypothetical protein